jgi:stage III sporulation protein AE
MKTAEFVGALGIGTVLLECANSMIQLGIHTTEELSAYGKLLLPVMTSALAAQGGITSSTALYAGTAFFNTILTDLLTGVLNPLVYIFLVLSTANAALGEELLKKMAAFVKWLSVWLLKTILYIFTGYMGLTGVISGTTDAAALKAAKLTISGVVPVVGGILSDASEAVLISAGMVRNAAGIYGILAILAVFAAPFLRIGCHYLLLRLTGAVCSVFGVKRCTDLIGDFSSAMGLLLAMTGSVCLLQLISTVCFLRGVG